MLITTAKRNCHMGHPGNVIHTSDASSAGHADHMGHARHLYQAGHAA